MCIYAIRIRAVGAQSDFCEPSYPLPNAIEYRVSPMRVLPPPPSQAAGVNERAARHPSATRCHSNGTTRLRRVSKFESCSAPRRPRPRDARTLGRRPAVAVTYYTPSENNKPFLGRMNGAPRIFFGPGKTNLSSQVYLIRKCLFLNMYKK